MKLEALFCCITDVGMAERPPICDRYGLKPPISSNACRAGKRKRKLPSGLSHGKPSYSTRRYRAGQRRCFLFGTAFNATIGEYADTNPGTEGLGNVPSR